MRDDKNILADKRKDQQVGKGARVERIEKRILKNVLMPSKTQYYDIFK